MIVLKKEGETLLSLKFDNGEMAEWTKAAASKAVVSLRWDRGFESYSLRHKNMINKKQLSLVYAHH